MTVTIKHLHVFLHHTCLIFYFLVTYCILFIMIFCVTYCILLDAMMTASVGCSLPCFSLPCAVDVLTTGTYSRLPTCIRVCLVCQSVEPPTKWSLAYNIYIVYTVSQKKQSELFFGITLSNFYQLW